MTQVASRTLAAALVLAIAASVDVDAQARAAGQGRQGARAPMGPRDGLTPREIQAQFDAYVIAQAESALQITDDQYAPFVRRVRALQSARRDARVQRNRLLHALGQLLRARENADEAQLAAATRAIDEHERSTLAGVQKSYAAIDEILTPWQRARFRVLEDQLEQKKLDMLMRARQGPRR